MAWFVPRYYFLILDSCIRRNDNRYAPNPPHWHLLWTRLRFHGEGLSCDLWGEVTFLRKATCCSRRGFFDAFSVWGDLSISTGFSSNVSVSMECHPPTKWCCYVSCSAPNTWVWAYILPSSNYLYSWVTQKYPSLSTLSHIGESLGKPRIKNTRRSECIFPMNFGVWWRYLWSPAIWYFSSGRTWGIGICEEELWDLGGVLTLFGCYFFW